MSKTVVVTEKEFHDLLADGNHEKCSTEDNPLMKWGWRALRFVDDHDEEWFIIPYMSLGTFIEAKDALSKSPRAVQLSNS